MTDPRDAVARAETVLAWGARHLRDLPWRATRDAWAILVSEVMAQQTGVDRVVPYWHDFLARFPTPAACAAAPVGDVVRLWSGLGYNRRAVNLHRCAVAVVESHAGTLPDDLDALLGLPGVGPYTARAVLAFAFEQPVGVVDTNVGRVLARWECRSLGPSDAQALADSLVRTARRARADHGRDATRMEAGDAYLGRDATRMEAGDAGHGSAGDAGDASQVATGSKDASQVATGDAGSVPAPEHPDAALAALRLASTGDAAGPAWLWNQAVMELGGTVCRRRRPDCRACPVRRWCGWAAAGLSPPDPADGSAGVSAGQPRFEGSDRQGRGRLVDALCRGPVPVADVPSVMGWPDDPARADRVAIGLLDDGLAVRDGDTLRLP